MLRLDKLFKIQAMNNASNSNAIKGLGGLAGLAGLVVKETPPVSPADLAANVRAIAQAKADAQKAKDVATNTSRILV